MTCKAEVNGTTLECSCNGCGISYDGGKYTTLCCGNINTFSVKNQADDPIDPPKPNHIMVDFAGLTLLEAAQILDRAAPGEIMLNDSLQHLQKRITLKANQPLVKLINKLGLHSKSK
jgi:hypothetical protein